jgi:hypothetical protein
MSSEADSALGEAVAVEDALSAGVDDFDRDVANREGGVVEVVSVAEATRMLGVGRARVYQPLQDSTASRFQGAMCQRMALSMRSSACMQATIRAQTLAQATVRAQCGTGGATGLWDGFCGPG